MRLPVRCARALPATVLIAAGSALAGCATGGHVQAVERFTVTAVRSGG